jgi:hypothetical protein
MKESIETRWTQLADTIGQTCLDILGGVPVTVTGKRFADPKVLAVMLASRALSNFRGVFVLIENGLVVEARILVRCCFENAFWIAGLHAKGDGFVKKMLEDEMRSRKVRGEWALSKRPQLSEEVERRLREQLQLINKKWNKAKSLSPKDVALSGLLREGYGIYSQLSADAAHPTVTSLNRHVGQSEKEHEALIDVVPAPKDEEIITTWDWACNAMLGVCVGVNEILGGAPAGQGLLDLADRYQALTTRSGAANPGSNTHNIKAAAGADEDILDG